MIELGRLFSVVTGGIQYIVNANARRCGGVKAGDFVTIASEPDTEKCEIEIMVENELCYVLYRTLVEMAASSHTRVPALQPQRTQSVELRLRSEGLQLCGLHGTALSRRLGLREVSRQLA
jgi:hypothetical protein